MLSKNVEENLCPGFRLRVIHLFFQEVGEALAQILGALSTRKPSYALPVPSLQAVAINARPGNLYLAVLEDGEALHDPFLELIQRLLLWIVWLHYIL